MLAGGLLVPAAVFGQIMGGLCDSKRSKNLSQTANLTKYVAAVALVSVLCIYTVQCPTLQWSNPKESSCSNTCHCIDKFDPICIDGTELHFNGCYSGCNDYNASLNLYSNCLSCGGNHSSSMKIKHGACDSMKCDKMMLMIVIFFLAVFFTFMNNPPSQMVMMRAVPPHLAANALALNDLCYRLLGSIPGVPIWAAAIDATCLHFNVDECGNKGSCGVYDNGAIAIIFLYLGGIPKLLSVIFFMIGAWWLSSKMSTLALKPYTEDKEDAAPSI